MLLRHLPLAAAVSIIAGCHDRRAPQPDASTTAAGSATVSARETPPVPSGTPYVPPQCYTRTRDADGRVHNPCFTCHADAAAPNYVADGSLQLSYDFGPASRVNPWTNLFVDRTAAVAAISDAEILSYVRQDNYRGFAARLAASSTWDEDGDGRWSGWLPDVAFELDDAGFDHASDGSFTGWRAYAYLPLPGGFWPTNGSFGDAFIRLPAAFREDRLGHFDRRVYATNLAILEALIVRRDVAIEPTDERAIGVDLDGDGALGEARVVRFRWKPGNDAMSWAGVAGTAQREGKIRLTAGLFPEGTELAHSLRYLDVANGRARMAPRMKELRYMVKTSWHSYGRLEEQAAKEAAEKEASPNKTRAILGSSERGISTGAGWRLSGFIEDAEGALRPQTLEEQTFCIGCHSGIGVTDDSVFSFGRKLSGEELRRGWFHPTQKDLTGVGELVRADGHGEYGYYLAKNGAGDELRANDELSSRFFDANGELRPEIGARLRTDVSTLLLPSEARALLLDKAYLTIVRAQTFTRGRDATVAPAKNVHRELPAGEPLPTGVSEPLLDRRRLVPRKSMARATSATSAHR